MGNGNCLEGADRLGIQSWIDEPGGCPGRVWMLGIHLGFSPAPYYSLTTVMKKKQIIGFNQGFDFFFFFSVMNVYEDTEKTKVEGNEL